MSKPLTLENTKDEFPAADNVVAEVAVGLSFAVRETQRLYRLKAARFLATVAADTEDEARSIAARHDALRGDWSNPEFASSEFEDTGEVHVFGDVIISALAAPPTKRPKKASRKEFFGFTHPCHCATGTDPE
jgi:GGDEF domain-containing protein